MAEPLWLSRRAVDTIHAELIREHGGSAGLRDTGLVESALARPRNRWGYGGGVPLEELAAAYAYGLARNHGYVDGNKRVAFAAAAVFLILNGWRLAADEGEAYAVMMDVAAGVLSEQQLARWIGASMQRGSE